MTAAISVHPLLAGADVPIPTGLPLPSIVVAWGFLGVLGRLVERRAEAEMGVADLADEVLDAVEVGDVARAHRQLLAGADPSANSWNVPVMAEAADRLGEPMVRLQLEFGGERDLDRNSLLQQVGDPLTAAARAVRLAGQARSGASPVRHRRQPRLVGILTGFPSSCSSWMEA
jgi:hypothetical protein